MIVDLPEEDVEFLRGFDPDRDRSASRADLVRVIEHLQEALAAVDDQTTWRVGRSYGIHVYEHGPSTPADDRPVATFHDPADAERAVVAVNAGVVPDRGFVLVPPAGWGNRIDEVLRPLIDRVVRGRPATEEERYEFVEWPADALLAYREASEACIALLQTWQHGLREAHTT